MPLREPARLPPEQSTSDNGAERPPLPGKGASSRDLNLYRQIVETAAEGIMITAPDATILFANQALGEMLGLNVPALWGRSLSEFLDEQGWREVQARIARRKAGHRGIDRFELCIRRADGQTAWMYASTSALTDENGQYKGTLAMLSDVTPLKQAEEQLRLKHQQLEQAKQAAEAAASAKSRFLATASHEIRTPMNGVVGMANLLLETALSPEQREMVETIRNSAEALLRVINDLLDVARMEAGKLSIKLAPFDLRAVITQVATLLRPVAESKGLGIQVDYPALAPAHFVGDADRIRQVLLNLVGNAIKFTWAGEVRLSVRCSEPAGGQATVRVLVQDTGIGIPQEKQALLFQRFAQLHAEGAAPAGAGLGLAISKEIVELMGGRIGFESRPGQGSTFWFELRLAPADEPARQAGADLESQPVFSSQLANAKPRILVADDDPINQRVVQKLLERVHCEADVVANGLEVLARLDEQRYDLILLDCQMPLMDGFTVARHIRQRESASAQRTPIIALTASALEDDRERAVEAGMDDWLVKPIQLQDLRHAIERWCKRPPAAGTPTMLK